MPDPAPPSRQHVLQAPSGTRDLYPVEAARRRYITEAWRRVSINHGFEEIDGPTFEHLDLYKVKSGEGIVSELFSFTRAGGEKDYALRPEFTPTLARMYAARAASLPKPTKWFTTGAFFRAERPQRGRLREFLQWNCDIIGLQVPESGQEIGPAIAKAQADVELIACSVELLKSLGLSPQHLKVHINDRALASSLLQYAGVAPDRVPDGLALLDLAGKDSDRHDQLARSLGFSKDRFQEAEQYVAEQLRERAVFNSRAIGLTVRSLDEIDFSAMSALLIYLGRAGLAEWLEFNPRLARGLAYYTGMVFELIVDGERAVAGGGRYDNLIELFGGPPTPAVGFGMGDVVLVNVLQDKGLMPGDAELMGLAGQSPDAFVIPNGTPEADAALPKVLADLRRAPPSTASRPGAPPSGLHARRSYKTTKNVGKLLQDASKAGARFAVIIESETEATIKDLATGAQDQHKTPLDSLAAELRKRLGR